MDNNSKRSLNRERHVAEQSEILLERVGSFGRYQMLYMLLVQLFAWQGCGNFMLLSYAGLKTSFVCGNVSIEAEAADICQMTDCENYTVARPYGFKTLISEWPHLILDQCDGNKSAKFISPRKATISAVMVCAGLSIVPAGIVSDLFGRRPILAVGSAGITFLGILSAYVPTYLFHSIVYLLAVALGTFVVIPAMSLLSEYTAMKYRLIMNFAISWFMAYLVSALVGYLTQDWRKYLIVYNTMGIPLMFLFQKVGESPRWLLIKGRYTEAAATLNAIAEFNKVETRVTKEELEKTFAEYELGIQAEKPRSIDPREVCGDTLIILKELTRIFTYKSLRPVTLMLLVFEWGAALLAMSFTFNLDHFAYSPYATVAILGGMRLWSPLLIAFLELKLSMFKRRSLFWLGSVFVLIPLTIALIFRIIETFSESFEEKAKQIFTVFHLIANAANFGLLWFAYTQCALEVYPTIIRSAALGVIYMSATTAAAVGPVIMGLQQTWRPIPYIIITVIMWGVFFMARRYFPETKGKDLPDTFDDLHMVFGPDAHLRSETASQKPSAPVSRQGTPGSITDPFRSPAATPVPHQKKSPHHSPSSALVFSTSRPEGKQSVAKSPTLPPVDGSRKTSY